MELIRRERSRLFAERDTVVVQPTATAREREQIVTEALDFATTAKTLKGPALRELIQRWVARAEFNTCDRGLTVEIRTVPALAKRISFKAEGEGFEPPSPFGRRFSSSQRAFAPSSLVS